MTDAFVSMLYAYNYNVYLMVSRISFINDGRIILQQSEVNTMKIKRYEAKDEAELLKLIDEDPDKLKGWVRGETHLRSVRYPPTKAKGKVRAGNC